MESPDRLLRTTSIFLRPAAADAAADPLATGFAAELATLDPAPLATGWAAEAAALWLAGVGDAAPEQAASSTEPSSAALKGSRRITSTGYPQPIPSPSGRGDRTARVLPA